MKDKINPNYSYYLIGIVLILFTVSICSAESGSTSIPGNVSSIGCLFNPSYEKVVILGDENKITMTADVDKTAWPWSNVIYKHLNDVPIIISNANNPNIEELLKNKPDLIFFWNNSAVVQKMTEAGIAVVSLPSSRKFTDDKTQLQIYANALGPDAKVKADEYAKYFDEKLAMVKSRTSDIPEENRPSVYFAIQKPLETAGINSDISEEIRLAGGKSVTEDLSAGFGSDISMEQLSQWNPDYIIIDHCRASSTSKPPADTLSDMMSDPAFSELNAVKNQQVFISPTGVMFWDGGQQQILQLMWLAKLLHPDKFEDINMETELKEFYSKFFGYDLTDDEADRILKSLPPASS